jgi:polyisoprenoid-binding protein YceI
MVPTRVNGVRCVIDTRVSQFTVQAFASGLGAAVTHRPKIAIRDWTGEAQFNPGNPRDFWLRVRVKAASLEVLDELRDDDRAQIHRVLTMDVLETARYPEIVYESSEAKAEKLRDDLYRVHVKGKWTFHGVSNDHAFVAQTALGTDSARAYGEFTLRPSDYSIGVASIAGGTWRLEDQLKFSFYMVARRDEGVRRLS